MEGGDGGSVLFPPPQWNASPEEDKMGRAGTRQRQPSYGGEVGRGEVKCRVAVVLGGRGVDANLRILQVIGSPESRIVERVASLNCARKRRDVVQFSWELAEDSA
ncbi:hypothetical protein Taro_006007 [Colocasia esculenta]|uniref:Uncharacterized protein n=1 Tax=Colocasia esculenta TaxID=4460 RepID=A0A843TU52_COLES|nr:hypothetical protein [Colocasia esculenta]